MSRNSFLHTDCGTRAHDATEQFLRSFPVDARAEATFRACLPSEQEQVMMKGIEGAIDPSSVLMARIRDIEHMAPLPPPPPGSPYGILL